MFESCRGHRAETAWETSYLAPLSQNSTLRAALHSSRRRPARRALAALAGRARTGERSLLGRRSAPCRAVGRAILDLADHRAEVLDDLSYCLGRLGTLTRRHHRRGGRLGGAAAQTASSQRIADSRSRIIRLLGHRALPHSRYAGLSPARCECGAERSATSLRCHRIAAPAAAYQNRADYTASRAVSGWSAAARCAGPIDGQLRAQRIGLPRVPPYVPLAAERRRRRREAARRRDGHTG